MTRERIRAVSLARGTMKSGFFYSLNAGANLRANTVKCERSEPPLIARQVQRSLAGGSEKLAKLLRGQARIAYDTTHRETVDGVVPRNRQDALAI
jgi:hypothetical protein